MLDRPSAHTTLFSWTDENTARFREMVLEGKLTGTEIAKELGCSRNAVLGKAWRMKLTLGEGKRGPTPRVQRLTKEERDRIVAARKQKAAARKAALLGFRPMPNAPARTARVCVPVPLAMPPRPAEALRVVDLREEHCRWPIGDRDFTFCGAKRSDGSYCAFHSGLAYSNKAAA